MTSIIKTSVLRAAVLTAFDRGRYTVHFGTTPTGDDLAVVPASIVLDLGERDDDLLGAEPCSNCDGAGHVGAIAGEPNTFMGCTACMGFGVVKREVDTLWTVSREQAERLARHASPFHSDDHGAAVPAQDGHGCRGEDVAPVIKGMADVAADLRAKVQPLQAGDTVRVLKYWEGHVAPITKIEDDMIFLSHPGHGLGAFKPEEVERIAPAAPTPPAPGPLTSAEGLMRGDVLRVKVGREGSGEIKRVRALDGPRHVWEDGDDERSYHFDCYDFIGRPDADGWLPWSGGANPVGSAVVTVIFRDGQRLKAAGDILDPFWSIDSTGDGIDRFQIVDMPPLSGDA